MLTKPRWLAVPEASDKVRSPIGQPKSGATETVPVSWPVKGRWLPPVAAGVSAVAAGLWRGGSWSRTPAILIQALLLVATFSLIGPGRPLVVGLICGVVAIAGLAMLLGAPARRWAEDLDERRRG